MDNVSGEDMIDDRGFSRSSLNAHANDGYDVNDHEMRTEWEYVQHQHDNAQNIHRRIPSGVSEDEWHDCMSMNEDSGAGERARSRTLSGKFSSHMPIYLLNLYHNEVRLAC